MIVTKIVLKIMLNNKKLKAYWYFATIVLIAKTIMEIFVEWKKVYEYIYIGTPCLIALGFVYFIIQRPSRSIIGTTTSSVVESP